jgi:ABC-2 type transport system ATP-binding protein
MHEASELCDRVAIINQGRIAEIDTPEHLKQAIERVHSVEIVFEKDYVEIIEKLKDLPSVREAQKRGLKFRLFTLEPPRTLQEVFEFTKSENLQLMSVNTLSPTLEDVFLELTGEEIIERPSEPRKGGKQRFRRKR